MTTQKLLFFLALILLSSSTSRAQDVTVTFLDGRKDIRLQLGPTTLPGPGFKKISKETSTYRLYEVETPDPDQACKLPHCIDEVHILNTQNPAECLDDVCRLIALHFTTGLESGKNFVLVVQQLKDDGTNGKVKFSSELKAKITDPYNANEKRKGFDVTANTRLKANGSISVKQTTYRLTKDSMNVEEFVPPNLTATVKAKPDGRLSFRLDSNLKDGQQYQFSIPEGITDDADNPIAAEGLLKIAGSPAPPADPNLSIKFASVSSTHAKSVFDLTSTFTKRLPRLPHKWTPEPNISVDVGLRSTTSNNAITIAFPFTRNLVERTAEKVHDAKSTIPDYADWAHSSWHKVATLKFYLGPKVELDREFKRINLLGSMRFDLNMFRWLGTIAYKRGLISEEPNISPGLRLGGLGKDKGALVDGIDTGFKLVPYLILDFGGHVNNETVTKNTSSVFVPRHGIFRTYLGGQGTIEWLTWAIPTTLTVDGSVVYLATTEQIGYTTDDAAFLRRLRGFHPHFKTSLDFAFDPGKHYSLDITYENGRAAPNFTYLNKVSTGIKLVY